MLKCKICGEEHHQFLEASLEDELREIDDIELAFYSVTPCCAQCGRRMAERGIEARALFFCDMCCAHAYDLATLENERQPELVTG